MAVYLDERTSLALIRAYRLTHGDPSLTVHAPRAPKPLPWKALPEGQIDAQPVSDQAFRALINKVDPEAATLFDKLSRVSLLVEVDAKRRRPGELVRATSVESHVLPAGAMCEIAPDIVACSPAFALVRLARSLSLGAWLLEAAELCGVYARNDGSSGMPVRTAPILSCQALSSFFEQVSGVRGVEAARGWAPYVLDGTASPSEAQIGALFALPVHRGGYGLPRPLVNVPLPNFGGQWKRAGFSGARRTPDFSWPDKKVVMEYDSDVAHAGGAFYKDARRRNEIESQGFTVVTLTRPQLHSASECDLVARQLAHHLGCAQRQRDFTPAWRKRNRSLRQGLGLPEEEW